MLFLSAPYILASRLVTQFGHVAIKTDIDRCSIATEAFSPRAIYLRQALVVAEDHRNQLHYGIDPIAILSAFAGRVFKGKKRGASTIEQQFVRVITQRYERTVRRKIRGKRLGITPCQV
ncbi:MAG: hypothetical protein CL581_16460 [Alteromonadaceae bacterium]|nr:hypothetical protein [Alteromonadaceae bacterium]MBH86606.1 hypothetical protein [Alteromonadaceae bacterium]|tara:strand:+ start:827 stop:1183 length:357 start_codon:yes stop_codon:yes gene_type:complete